MPADRTGGPAVGVPRPGPGPGVSLRGRGQSSGSVPAVTDRRRATLLRTVATLILHRTSSTT